MSAPALDARGLEAAADSLTPMGRAARWPQEYVEEQAAFVVAAYLRAAEAPKAASPPAEWPWPREVCFRCLHVLHPTDEGACNCDFRGEAPIRVRVVKAEGLAERLEGTEALTDFTRDEQISLPPPVPKRGAEGEPCVRCEGKPATHQWGDALAQTHGWTKWWCERCVVEVQLDHALKRAECIPRLKVELMRLGGPARVRAGGGR